MKIVYKEHDSIDYSNYHFPYCIYCLKEKKDNYNDIYKNGFLPYTNDLDVDDEIYYLARSVRIDLNTKLWNYKQKNVLNKMRKIYDDDNFKIELNDKSLYLNDASFKSWCLQNAKNDFLSQERLAYILSRPYLEKIMKISHGSDTLAYLFIVTDDDNFLHVWYSFYDLSKNVNDFGKWILLKTIEWCKNTGYNYFYIGTCYSKSALYKLTLSSFTTYYNGNEWIENTSKLKKKLLDGVL